MNEQLVFEEIDTIANANFVVHELGRIAGVEDTLLSAREGLERRKPKGLRGILFHGYERKLCDTEIMRVVLRLGGVASLRDHLTELEAGEIDINRYKIAQSFHNKLLEMSGFLVDQEHS